MATFNPSDLTFSGKEIQAMNEAIFAETYGKPTMSEFHTVVEGIKAKSQIAIAGLIGNVGKAAVGCPPAADGAIPWTEKFWNPENIEIRLLQCWSELLPSFQAWGLSNGVAKSDLTKTDYWNFVVERMADAIMETVYRLAYLGDTAQDDIAGGGDITNGVDPLYYTSIDGIFKQAFAIGNNVAIGANAGATYLLQKLVDGEALATFESMVYDNADFRLRAATDQLIVCTQSMADNYAKYLRSQGNDESFKRIEGGFTSLSFEGIPIIGFSLLDRKIRADFDTGVVHYLPHRAIYTTKSNLQIGVDGEGQFNDVASNYDAKSKETFVDALWSMDAKLPLDYLVVSAS